MSGFGSELLGLFTDFINTQSAAYQSFNGNGTRQNLFGAQITNSFGSSITCQMDMVRLWQDMTLAKKTFGQNEIENYAEFESKNLTSRVLGAIRAFESLNYQYFTQGFSWLAITDEAEKYAVDWNGYLTIMLGDTAQMNFKGDNMSITRAVNDITYATSKGKQQQWGDIDADMKSFYYYVYCLSVLMKTVFDTIVGQFSASMSATATLIVEIIETIFILLIPSYQAKLSKRLLYKEKENANAYIGDDSETAVMQDEFKANSKKLQDQISDSATALKELQTAKGVLESDVAAFQSELAQLKADAATYKASLAQSQAEVDALKASLQALEDVFKAKTDGLVTELTTLQAAMEKDRLGFTSALNGLSEQYNKKLAELNSIVESEMVRLDELKADTDAQIAELNRQYKEALAKFEAMVAKGEMTSILSQVGTLFQIKASQINMALQGYYLIQQDVMVAIQEQKCAKVLNRSIEQAVVDRNILALEEQLLFIRSETAVLNGKLSALEAQECEYVAMIQSAAGLNLAATNGDAAIDLNPAAGEIAAILDEINLGITTEQTAMNDAIQARCVLVNAALEQCTGSLGESASRSIGTRAAHKTTKRLGEGVEAIAAGGRKAATLLNPRNWGKK